MLFRLRKSSISFIHSKGLYILVISLLCFMLSSCVQFQGTIMIKENDQDQSVTINLEKYNDQSEWKITLNQGDVLLFEITHEKGQLSLIMIGKKGSNPYTGNDIKTSRFTVTVQETDDYVIKIIGKKATSDILIRNTTQR